MNDDKQPSDASVNLRLEVVVVPVSDVDRAKRFYAGLGWRLDADIASGDAFRIVQFTPPGSPCSVQFGKGITAAAPGSAQSMYLVVSDIEQARAALLDRGVAVGGVFHRAAGGARADGPDAERASYKSFASFSDPDGNSWLLQEVTTRLPGRVQGRGATLTAGELAAALRRAEAAQAQYEQALGHRDQSWPDWYAAHIVREQSAG
jgi:catechol 2,3-dioxygenase-like lactoylglutathione lyase family enzyme